MSENPTIKISIDLSLDQAIKCIGELAIVAEERGSDELYDLKETLENALKTLAIESITKKFNAWCGDVTKKLDDIETVESTCATQ